MADGADGLRDEARGALAGRAAAGERPAPTLLRALRRRHLRGDGYRGRELGGRRHDGGRVVARLHAHAHTREGRDDEWAVLLLLLFLLAFLRA